MLLCVVSVLKIFGSVRIESVPYLGSGGPSVMPVPSVNSHGESGRQFGWYWLSTTGETTLGTGGVIAGLPYGLSAPSGTSVSWMLLRARLPVISANVSHSRATIVTNRSLSWACAGARARRMR